MFNQIRNSRQVKMLKKHTKNVVSKKTIFPKIIKLLEGLLVINEFIVKLVEYFGK